MKTLVLRRVVPISLMAAAALVIGAHAVAQEGVDEAPLTHIAGTFNDYVWVEASQGFGPWHVTGEWSARVNTYSGKAEFIASLLGVRSDLWVLQFSPDPPATANRSPHTHHVSLPDANVEFIPNGTLECLTPPRPCIRLKGPAIITANGSPAYPGSELHVDFSGGNLIRYSNIRLTFHGTEAVNHFGPQPYDGIVVLGR